MLTRPKLGFIDLDGDGIDDRYQDAIKGPDEQRQTEDSPSPSDPNANRNLGLIITASKESPSGASQKNSPKIDMRGLFGSGPMTPMTPTHNHNPINTETTEGVLVPGLANAFAGAFDSLGFMQYGEVPCGSLVNHFRDVCFKIGFLEAVGLTYGEVVTQTLVKP